jgi:NDP-sugar pyrophosphorylase family protein
MQVIIPMSGEGSRFKAAGYQNLKPLISIHGKPLIEYVVEMFPGNHTFIFVCREDHAELYDFDVYLPSLAPNAKVVKIKPHKLGPVYAALQAENVIDPNEQIILSYCDYYMRWDFNSFIEKVTASNVDGDVICYKGFHPHLLHKKNVYAGCRVDKNNSLVEIKEKFSFEENKTLGFHSCGAYYFKSGKLMLDYFNQAIEINNSLNGEFYASLVFNQLIKDNLNVSVFDEIEHFCQWGTPEDLEEYLYWSKIFLNNNYK